MSESLSGMVFSFYALVSFLSAPLFGKIVSRKLQVDFEIILSHKRQLYNENSVHQLLLTFLLLQDTNKLLFSQLPQVGARFLFMMGMFVAGSCNVLFG